MKRIGVLLALVGLAGVLGLSAIAGAGGNGETARANITKVVRGEPPPGTTFVIEVRCQPAQGQPFTETFVFGEDGGTDGFDTNQEIDCEVEEIETGGADSVDYECETDGNIAVVECNTDRTFEIDGDDAGNFEGEESVTVTVTNTFVREAQPFEVEPTFTG